MALHSLELSQGAVASMRINGIQWGILALCVLGLQLAALAVTCLDHWNVQAFQSHHPLGEHHHEHAAHAVHTGSCCLAVAAAPDCELNLAASGEGQRLLPAGMDAFLTYEPVVLFPPRLQVRKPPGALPLSAIKRSSVIELPPKRA